MSATDTTARAEPAPLVRLLLDLGPLVAFFLTNLLAPGDATQRILTATLVFMIATAVAMIVAKLKLGAISPMLLVSGVMVLVFGGLTLGLRNELFIKIKPTVYYATISAILLFGLSTGRPTLKLVLGTAYPGLSDQGWALLSRNWALFFIALGIANEVVWRTTTTEFWLGYKFWGALPETMIFAFANIPMLMRHGMSEPKAAEEAALPPQG